jgi:hypothetical protein
MKKVWAVQVSWTVRTGAYLYMTAETPVEAEAKARAYLKTDRGRSDAAMEAHECLRDSGGDGLLDDLDDTLRVDSVEPDESESPEEAE